MKILAIIPARGGSKGIRKKNIIEVCGKPLLFYTIKPALDVLDEDLINELILSTDNKEIASVAKEIGVGIPFLRPSKFASDTAPAIEYIIQALDFFEKKKKKFDAVLLLQPTSPLRTSDDIRNAVKLFKENNADSLISVYQEDSINDLIMYRELNNFAIPLNKLHNAGIRRQDHDPIYIRNGAIYIAKTNFIRKYKKLISDQPLILKMPKDRSINIDTYKDLELLRNSLYS